MGQQISYLTVIVVHSTMHLMHHNHCQRTTICVLSQVQVSTKYIPECCLRPTLAYVCILDWMNVHRGVCVCT